MAATSPSLREARRHAYVDHGDVDVVAGQRRVERRRVVDRLDDRDPAGLEDPGQADPEEGLVLGEDGPEPGLRSLCHGTSKVTTVGPPTGLSTLIVPSKAASPLSHTRQPGPGRVGPADAVVADDDAQHACRRGSRRPTRGRRRSA